jgi:hypothetical protein
MDWYYVLLAIGYGFVAIAYGARVIELLLR